MSLPRVGLTKATCEKETALFFLTEVVKRKWQGHTKRRRLDSATSQLFWSFSGVPLDIFTQIKKAVFPGKLIQTYKRANSPSKKATFCGLVVDGF